MSGDRRDRALRNLRESREAQQVAADPCRLRARDGTGPDLRGDRGAAGRIRRGGRSVPGQWRSRGQCHDAVQARGVRARHRPFGARAPGRRRQLAQVRRGPHPGREFRRRGSRQRHRAQFGSPARGQARIRRSARAAPSVARSCRFSSRSPRCWSSPIARSPRRRASAASSRGSARSRPAATTTSATARSTSSSTARPPACGVSCAAGHAHRVRAGMPRLRSRVRQGARAVPRIRSRGWRGPARGRRRDAGRAGGGSVRLVAGAYAP